MVHVEKLLSKNYGLCSRKIFKKEKLQHNSGILPK